MELVHDLFQGITKEEFHRMAVCFHASEKSYAADEYVCSYGEGNVQIGIVTEGCIQLIRTHADGRQTILEQLKAGNIFGESLSFVALSASSIQVYSVEKSRILYMDYSHLIKRCPNACPFHSQLVSNALKIISQKAVSLSERLEVLSQRSIREKLQCYFSILAAKNNSNNFTLPFSYGVLADYLSVDRSAMMRELKKMREENILQTSRYEIILL